ncbi:hypothetical protein [uncultured Alistipes sp.]|jgi:hypothetical protein|uniref:hypothetical protein n=1 Tax=uncultured Alistipes sp. TaxID=538949 RepID=UPI0025CD1822|nr:hypothetical protein [uncultured Alistipes sp.]
MKNFFKPVLTFVAACVALGASAQEDPSKETVIVNPFTHTAAVSQAASDNIRAAVLAGISDRGRFHIVDALTDEVLSGLYANRNIEDVVNDANWQSESEAAYKKLGASKVLIGQANNVSFSRYKSDIDGKMTDKCEVTVSLKVYSITDGSMVGSENVAVTGIATESKDGSFNNAMKDLRKAMTKFVDNHFKFETYILELGDSDKKGRLKELYISGGTEMGVAKKTRFKVYCEQKIGPKVTKKEIGTIVAIEVMDGVTKCQIAEGDAAIKEKFSNGEKLTVVVDKQGTAAGGFLRGLVS